MTPTRIVIIAKAPVAGFAKTRLIPALGAQTAAELAKRLLLSTITTALSANLGKVELCATPDPTESIAAGESEGESESESEGTWKNLGLPPGIEWSAQGEGDLGERMARASLRCIQRSESILLIGTDCPALTVDVLQSAAQGLLDHDAVMVPTHDGGYALLGLNQFDASVFEAMPWSTDQVARITLDRLKRLNWSIKTLATQHDIDEATDLQWLPESWGYRGRAKPTHPVTLP